MTFIFRNIKDISVGTIGDINQSSKELYRELSDGKHGLTKAEFTVEVQIPHNMERGPLLVTDVKQRIIAFVSPKERGYDVSSRYITVVVERLLSKKLFVWFKVTLPRVF